MFLDASAIVSIITLENDAATLAALIEGAERCLTSAIAVYEAALAVSRKKGCAIELARLDVEAFLDKVGAALVPINGETGRLALEAQGRFGKSVRHPARLNLGDCFAYALAKQHGVPLLYKGDDFSQTDLA